LYIWNSPTLKDFSSISKLKKLENFHYKLHDNENHNFIIAKLKALQKELPNCTFDIRNEEGKPVKWPTDDK
jgi:hypothetical protein